MLKFPPKPIWLENFCFIEKAEKQEFYGKKDQNLLF
jgi:hypothetical protein